MFGMRNTSLTRYKTDVSECPDSVYTSHTRQFTLNASLTCSWKKRKPVGKKKSKTKARFRQEKIAISNMHSIGNRTYKEIKRQIQIQIKGMFTASSQRIKSSMTGGRLQAGISSQIPEKYKQRNMRWTDVVRFRERNGGLGRDLQFSSVLVIRVLHFISTCLVFQLKLLILLSSLPRISFPKWCFLSSNSSTVFNVFF